MITELHIENIAVIKRLTVDFKNGFSVLTGETGAGKSIIIDSVNLLLGARSAKELVRSGESSALVSACFSELPDSVLTELSALDVFPEEDGSLYLQRTLSSDGKASAKLNGRSVPVSLLKEIGALLINIHGQHDSQKLLTPEKHIDFLDAYAGTEPLLNDYSVKYGELLEIRKRLRQSTKSESEIEERTETLNRQIAEIESAKLKAGEQSSLLTKLENIKNIEKISRYTSEIERSLTDGDASACELVSKAKDAVLHLTNQLENADKIAERLDYCLCELKDIAESAAALTDWDLTDPEAELDRIETRLDLISRLERKYAPDIEGILEYKENAKKELLLLKSNGETVEKLKKELVSKAREAAAAADKITELRKKAATRLSKEITEQLHYLDLEKTVFEVSVTDISGEDGKKRFSQNGCDSVEFLISTNPGEPLKALSKVASGGELSRVMLALKSVLADSDGVQTLIFDEIDAGVSGKTSEKIGIRLGGLSKAVQVLCITHSAQIAAYADTHYKIIKAEKDGRSETSVKELGREERISELSRIMGGISITETVRKTADEMLSSAGK